MQRASGAPSRGRRGARPTIRRTSIHLRSGVRSGVTVRYQLTPLEVARVLLRHRPPGRFLFWWRAGSALLGLGVAVASLRWASPEFAVFLPLAGEALFVFATGLLLAAPGRRRRACAREVGRYPVFTEPKELSFDERGLVVATPHSRVETAWADFSRIEQDDALVCLYAPGAALPAVVVPQCAFDDDARREFRRCSAAVGAGDEPAAAPFFDDAEIARLIRAQPIRGPLPFDPDDDASVRRFYGEVVEQIERELGLRARVEWSHYGSGYASFIEAWFYAPDGRASLPPFGRGEERHVGLAVLLSRLSPFFVLGQDEHSWSANGGSGGLLNFSAVDDISHPRIMAYVAPLTARLTAAGLHRLARGELAARLPADCPVPTILADGALRQFDALFYWED